MAVYFYLSKKVRVYIIYMLKLKWSLKTSLTTYMRPVFSCIKGEKAENVFSVCFIQSILVKFLGAHFN